MRYLNATENRFGQIIISYCFKSEKIYYVYVCARAHICSSYSNICYNGLS